MSSRAYTIKEARKKFLTQCRSTVDYWENESRATTSKEKLEGLMFSILSLLDGCNANNPGFLLIPYAHETDEEYAKSIGEKYYPMTKLPEDVFDIGGTLHEEWGRVKNGADDDATCL